VHYNFTDVPTVEGMIEKGEFLEYAEVHGNYYGTSIKQLQQENKIVVLDIDVQVRRGGEGGERSESGARAERERD